MPGADVNAADLLETLRGRGLLVWREGGRLWLSPRALVDSLGPLRADVDRHKDELLRLVTPDVLPPHRWTDGDRWFVGEWPGVEWPERPETFGRVYCRMER